jgi:hypothetical protein
MKNITFAFFIWGDEYIKNFKKVCYLFLKKEFNDNFFYDFKIKIEIWTLKNDTNKFSFLNFSSEKISINIINYDAIDKIIAKEAENKYQKLNILQRLSLIKNFNSKTLVFFLYPDFIWSIGSIKNIIKKMNNKLIATVYAPQVIEENFNKEKIDFKNINSFIFNNLHPIVTDNSINDVSYNFSTGACITYKNKHIIHFRNFHMHPICLNLKLGDIEILNSFKVSIDDDFIAKLNITKKNIYIPKNSNECMFASLFLKKNYNVTFKLKNTLKNYIFWVKNQCKENHFLLSKNNFFLKKNFEQKKTCNKKLSLFLKAIYKNINLHNDIFNDYCNISKKLNYLHHLHIKNTRLDFLHLDLINAFKENKNISYVENIFKNYKFSKAAFEFMYKKIYNNLYINKLKKYY